MRTNPLPAGVTVSSLAFDGRRIAAACNVGVLILAADGSSLYKLRPRELEQKGGACWCFFSSGGAELWLVDADAAAIQRLHLP